MTSGANAMLMLVAAFGLVSQTPAPAHAQIAEVIQASGAELTVSEAVDLRTLPDDLRSAVAKVVIARSERRPSVTLSRRDLVAQLRLRVPALGPWLDQTAPGTVTINFPSSPPVEAADLQRNCVKLVRNVPQDAFVQSSDLEAAACPATPRKAAVYYDSSNGFSRASAELPQGEIVLAPPASTLPALSTGKRLLLTVHVGPVTVQRTVSTVQPARSGAALFVADSTGAIFLTPSPQVVQ